MKFIGILIRTGYNKEAFIELRTKEFGDVLLVFDTYSLQSDMYKIGSKSDTSTDLGCFSKNFVGKHGELLCSGEMKLKDFVLLIRKCAK